MKGRFNTNDYAVWCTVMILYLQVNRIKKKIINNDADMLEQDLLTIGYSIYAI